MAANSHKNRRKLDTAPLRDETRKLELFVKQTVKAASSLIERCERLDKGPDNDNGC